MKLESCVDILSGYAFKSKLFNTEERGIPIIRIRDVTSNSVSTYYEGPYKDEYLINNGDLLVGMDGQFNLIEWQGGRALLNQRVCKLMPRKGEIDKNLIKFLLPKSLKEIEDRTAFVTVKHLSVKDIKEIELPLFDLKTQQRIAAILDNAAALRDKTAQLLKEYDLLAQSIFLEMFGDPVKNPKNWNKRTLKDVGNVITGSTPSSKKDGMFGGKIPFVTPSDLDSKDEFKRFVTDEGAKNSRTVKKGSLLVCCIGTIGKRRKIEKISAFNQQINAVEWNEKIDPFFGYMVFQWLKQEVIQRATSTTLPILKKSEFEKIKTIAPPITFNTNSPKKSL